MPNRRRFIQFALGLLASIRRQFARAQSFPAVTVNEVVYSYNQFTNGAGPFWATGATNIVDMGEGVMVMVGLDTVSEIEPPINVLPSLWVRRKGSWRKVNNSPNLTREPNLLVRSGNAVYVYTNRILRKEGDVWIAEPKIVKRLLGRLKQSVGAIFPEWPASETFQPLLAAWSYRNCAVDVERNELFVIQHTQNLYGAIYAALDLTTSETLVNGILDYPRDPTVPEPLRVAYHCTALKDRHVFLLGHTDILEYVPERKALREGYIFRRLMFSSSTDIVNLTLSDWKEVDSTEEYGGYTFALDIHVDASDQVHILWYRQNMDRTFKPLHPDTLITFELKYGIIKDGELVHSRTLHYYDDGEYRYGEYPVKARFQATPDGQLFVIYSVGGLQGAGHYGLKSLELFPDMTNSEPVLFFTSDRFIYYFDTAGTRFGSPPSRTAHITIDEYDQVRYLSVELHE